MVTPPPTTGKVFIPSQAELQANRAASSAISLLRPTPVELRRLAVKQPDPLARQVATLVGERVVGDELAVDTDHAWLVVLGYFAQALGLMAELAGVALPQRQGKMAPRRLNCPSFWWAS